MNRRIVLADDVVVFTSPQHVLAKLRVNPTTWHFTPPNLPKPRLYQMPWGTWYCIAREAACPRIVGSGDTPVAAYASWLRAYTKWA